MIATRLPGYTGVAGADQGYAPLPFKSEQVQMDYGKFGIVELQQLTFAFVPTPEELSQLLAGQAVYFQLLHDAIPPMKVYVGDPGEVPEQVKPKPAPDYSELDKITKERGFDAWWEKDHTQGSGE